MNLFELQERLKDFSQDQLVREMQAPTGMAPQYLVLSELQRRQRMMAEQQAQMPTPQTTVAEDAIAAAGVPQGGLADMARAMAPQTDMDMNTAAQPVDRMQQGGLAGVSRDLGAYSPTMTAGDARSPMMEEIEARRRRAAIAAAAEPLLRYNRDGAPNVEGFAADLASLGVIPEDELSTEERLDPRFYPTRGEMEEYFDTRGAYTDLMYAPTRAEAMLEGIGPMQGPLQPEPYSPVRQAAPLSARPDILMDLVPEPEVTPFTALSVDPDLPSGYTLSRIMFPFRDPEAERLRLLEAESAETAPEAAPETAAAERRLSFGDQFPPVDIRRAGDEELSFGGISPTEAALPLALPRGAEEEEQPTPPTGGRSGGVGGGAAAPAMDDVFEQDKWLALAQTGLSLMASRQPTLGGAIGEAGLAGITALRQARGERDQRLAAQQARADRMAAAAASASRRDGEGSVSATERAAYFRAANEALAEANALELAIERGGVADDLGMITPYTEGELAILERQLSDARSRANIFSGISNPSLANIQATLD